MFMKTKSLHRNKTLIWVFWAKRLSGLRFSRHWVKIVTIQSWDPLYTFYLCLFLAWCLTPSLFHVFSGHWSPSFVSKVWSCTVDLFPSLSSLVMYSDKSQIAEVQQNLFCWANIGLFWVDSVLADLKLDQFQKKERWIFWKGQSTRKRACTLPTPKRHSVTDGCSRLGETIKKPVLPFVTSSLVSLQKLKLVGPCWANSKPKTNSSTKILPSGFGQCQDFGRKSICSSALLLRY